MTTSPNRFAKLNARLPHKRAFVTGAGAGLGLELAKALAAEGWSVGLFDRDVERLAAAEADFSNAGLPALAYPGDVTQIDELTVAVNSFAGTHDGLDLMINNAGVAAVGDLMAVPLEDWRWTLDVNVMGVVHGCRAALPHLQRNGRGMIVNIASAAAFASPPSMAPYNATKAAVLALTETLAAELRGSGTQVSVVMPTFFESRLLQTLRGSDEARRLATKMTQAAGYRACDVASDILSSVASGEMYIVVPRSARYLWRFKRWMPHLFLRRLVTIRDRLRST